MTPPVEAHLVLADGSSFEGELVGATLPEGANVSGEIVFNTALTGYQEVLTDPSYAGQIITFTVPHIGNYGVNRTDFEARRPFCRGLIAREISRRVSNHRASGDLAGMLAAAGLTALAGVDTRRLTRLLRDTGSLNGAYGTGSHAELLDAARAERGTDGVDLVSEVTTPEPYTVGSGGRTIVAVDYGLKHSILRDLAGLGRVTVVPAGASAAEILERHPDGVFLSNGPGDPALLGAQVATLAELIGRVPVFGICLGHQLLAQALGASTYKLPFGHHGGNHPVRHLPTGSVEITSQNHNFCVDVETLGDMIEVTHLNLNDGTLEGMRLLGQPAFSVQYHPEAGPGPHDAKYLFAMFEAMIDDPLGWSRHAPVVFDWTPGAHAEVQLIQPEIEVGDAPA